jgi:hypothetical protein
LAYFRILPGSDLPGAPRLCLLRAHLSRSDQHPNCSKAAVPDAAQGGDGPDTTGLMEKS